MVTPRSPLYLFFLPSTILPPLFFSIVSKSPLCLYTPFLFIFLPSPSTSHHPLPFPIPPPSLLHTLSLIVPFLPPPFIFLSHLFFPPLFLTHFFYILFTPLYLQLISLPLSSFSFDFLHPHSILFYYPPHPYLLIYLVLSLSLSNSSL